MKPLFLVATATLIFFFAGAQNNFTKAKLFRTDGSQSEVFIRNTNYEGTQQVFDYHLTEGGKTSRIEAGEISRIEFEDGMVLEGFHIHATVISAAVLNRRMIDYENPENQAEGWFLLEKVMTGTYSFYQFVDRYSFSHYFYRATSDTGVQQLDYREYVDDESKLINKREFRNQLLFLATSSGCEAKLSGLIERTEYRLQPMIQVFRKLNECTGQSPVMATRRSGSGPIWQFSVSAGAAATSLTIPSYNPAFYPGLTENAFSSKIGPLLGASVEIAPNKRKKNYLISFDFFYHSYSASTDSLHPNSYITSIGKIKLSSFDIGPVVRFRIGHSLVRPFADAGAYFRTLAKSKDEFYVRDAIANTEKRSSLINGKTNSLALVGGLGLEYKRFSLHGRFLLPTLRSSTYYTNVLIIARMALSRKPV